MTVSKEIVLSSMIARFSLAVFTVLTCSTVAHSAVPTTLAELNEWYSQPTNGQNAADLVLRGASLVKISSKNWYSTLPWLDDTKPPDVDKPVPVSMDNAMATFLRENQNAFHYLREAADLEHSRYPIDFSKEPDLPLTHLSKVKLASCYLAICALHAASHGQASKSAEALIADFGLARSLAQEPYVISQLIRFAIIFCAREAMEQTFNRVTLPSDALYKLDELLQKLERNDSSGVGLYRGLVGNRLAEAAYFDLPLDKGDITLTNLLQMFNESEATNVTLANYPRSADKEFTENFYARILELTTNSHPERLSLIGTFSSQQMAVAKEKHYLLGYHDADGMRRAFMAEARSIASLRIARMAIALERLRAITGNYPETPGNLSLVAANLNTLDPFNGKQLEYKRNSTGYVLTTSEFEMPKGPTHISFQIVAAPPGKPIAK
jgi:hypothetical protein